ncbi:hypothetical protein ACLBOM_24955 [Escherichia coli]
MVICNGLSLVGFGLLIFITLLDTTAGVYRRVCFYDARHSPFRLRFSGGNMPVWLQTLRGLTLFATLRTLPSRFI